MFTKHSPRCIQLIIINLQISNFMMTPYNPHHHPTYSIPYPTSQVRGTSVHLSPCLVEYSHINRQVVFGQLEHGIAGLLVPDDGCRVFGGGQEQPVLGAEDCGRDFSRVAAEGDQELAVKHAVHMH